MANNQGVIESDLEMTSPAAENADLPADVVPTLQPEPLIAPKAVSPTVKPEAPAPKPPLKAAVKTNASVKTKSAIKAKPAVKAKTSAKTDAAPKPKVKPVAEKKANTAKPTVNAASPSKGPLNMNDMLTKFAEQAKANAEAFTAQFGERAKDAFAKSGKLAEESAAFNKSNVEALVESGKLAAKNMEMLRDESLSYMRKSFEDGSLAMKSLTSVTSPAEFFKACAENNRKAMDAAVAMAAKNSEMMVKMSSDAFAPISNRMSVISSQMKVA